MEYQLWLSIIAVLSALDKPRSAARFDFSDEDIVKVFYWCVIHDRPVSWELAAAWSSSGAALAADDVPTAAASVCARPP